MAKNVDVTIHRNTYITKNKLTLLVGLLKPKTMHKVVSSPRSPTPCERNNFVLFLLVSCLLTCCVNCVFLNFFLSLCTSFFRYTCFLKFFTRSSHSSFNLENQM